MTEPGDSVGSEGAQLRSLANRLTSLGAGQEQMQKDVDKIRAAANATLIVTCYVLACTAIIYFTVRYSGKSKP